MVLFPAQLRQVDKGVSVPSQVIPKQNRQVCSQGTCKSCKAESLSAQLNCRGFVDLILTQIHTYSRKSLYSSSIIRCGCHYIGELTWVRVRKEKSMKKA